MSEALAPFLLLAGALLVASLVSRPRLASAMIAIAGAVTGWLGWHAAGYMAIPVAALVVIVGLVQSLGGVIADGRAELSDDGHGAMFCPGSKWTTALLPLVPSRTVTSASRDVSAR